MFRTMDEGELAALTLRMKEHHFAADELILKEGDSGDSIHILIKGHARIITHNADKVEVLLDEAEPGAFFGELSLLTGEPRSASVKATGNATTLSLSRNDFLDFLDKNSQACINVISVLGNRLGRSSELLRMAATRNVNDIEKEQSTLGQRIADRFARIMGSWTFIIAQSLALGYYIVLNSVATTPHWDPYPFMLMSVLLSFQAAYSAPVIMMSQNRQTAKDRLIAENNYEVNVKASAEIALILRRLDDLEAHLVSKTHKN